MPPLDPDVARVEREGIAAFDALPLEAPQKKLRRAAAAVAVTMANPSRSMMLVTSASTLRRADTISASASVPGEIRISSSSSSAAMQPPASGSPSTIAINAEVSTAITGAARSRRRFRRASPAQSAAP